jgi:hypothetical protein
MTKIQPREYKQWNNKQWNWSSNKESSNKEKSRSWWIHYWILSDLLRRTNTNTHQTFLGNRKRRNATNLILWSQYYTHFRAEQRYNKKNL